MTLATNTRGSWWVCPAWLFVALLALVPVATGEDEERSPSALANRVLSATPSEVTALAQARTPDPWLVTDRLLALENPKAALAFARATPRTDKEVARLPAYVEAASKQDQTIDRAALSKAKDHFAAGRFDKALSVLEGRPTSKTSIVAVSIHSLRGDALERLQQHAESAAAYLAAADLARDIGWRAMESLTMYRRGVAYWWLEDGQGQIDAFKRRLDVETALESPVGMGRALYGVAGVHWDRMAYQQWKKRLQEALVLAERGKDYEYVAKIHSDQTLAPELRDDPVACIALAQKSLAALEQADGEGLAARFQPVPRDIAGARARLHLAQAAWTAQLGDIQEARKQGRLALRIAEEQGNKALAARARPTLHLIEGEWHVRRGEDLLALERYDRALQGYVNARWRSRAATTMRRLGATYSRLDNHAQALEMLRNAEALLEGGGPRSQPDLIDVKLLYGAISLGTGRTAEAERLYLESRALAGKTNDKGQQAEAESGLAQVYMKRSDYNAALQHISEALRLGAASGDLISRSRYLIQRGLIEASTGNHETALATMQEAEEAAEKSQNKNALNEAREQLAALLIDVGEYDEALQVLTELLELQKRATNRGKVADTLSLMADMHVSQERYDKALEVRREALGMYLSLGWRHALIVGRMKQGRARFWSGQREEALRDLKEVREDARNHGTVLVNAFCSGALAEAYLKLEKHALAMAAAKDAMDRTRAIGLDLTEEESAGLRESFASWHQIGGLAATAVGDRDALYEFLERGRATTLLASLGGRHAIREVTVDKELREAEDRARAAQAMAEAEYEKAVVGGAYAQVVSAKKALGDATTALEKAVGDIERSARGQADLDYLDVRPLAQVQSLLAEDQALVVYARLLDTAIAMVITKSNASTVNLGLAEPIRRAVSRLLDDENDYLVEGAVGAVADKLINPLALPKTIKHLLISPDGSLAYVPFAVLDDTRSITLVPSGTGYGLLREMPVWGGKRVLALGDPLYNVTDGKGLVRSRKLHRLEQSGKEAERVGDEVRLRGDASETEFRRLMQLHGDAGWRAVHLACHGHVDPERATRSSLSLASDEENDGSLTALEVFRLEVPANLVVLSGCETGLGRYRSGEGILGLTRAFMFAGAPRVLVSLWLVDDEATFALMSKFYELWNHKTGVRVSAAAALRQAQDHVRTLKDEDGNAKWAHPRYWAAWVLWGLP